MAFGRLFLVSGRVQGVFFRDSTRQVAESLGLTGHAINLPDGNVEVLACGEPHAVEQLATWLHEGPRMARVDRISARDVDVEPPAGFRTG
jgi:acylphosphatase